MRTLGLVALLLWFGIGCGTPESTSPPGPSSSADAGTHVSGGTGGSNTGTDPGGVPTGTGGSTQTVVGVCGSACTQPGATAHCQCGGTTTHAACTCTAPKTGPNKLSWSCVGEVCM